MIGDISMATNIYLITGYTDMRKSINGLCCIIKQHIDEEPSQQAIYLFCGKRCDRIKVILREPDGFVLLYKRLDVIQGRYRWPRNASEVKTLSWQQFDWLMSGLEIEQLRSEVAWFKHKFFGASSERTKCVPGQLNLLDKSIEEEPPVELIEPEIIPIMKKTRKKKATLGE